jgi:hypothetical protein
MHAPEDTEVISAENTENAKKTEDTGNENDACEDTKAVVTKAAKTEAEFKDRPADVKLENMLKTIDPLDQLTVSATINMMQSKGYAICGHCTAGKNIKYSVDAHGDITINFMCGSCQAGQARRAMECSWYAPEHICVCGSVKYVNADGTANALCKTCHKKPHDQRPTHPLGGCVVYSNEYTNPDGSIVRNGVWFPPSN